MIYSMIFLFMLNTKESPGESLLCDLHLHPMDGLKSREIVCQLLSMDTILMFYIIILQLMDCRGVKSNLEMFDAVCQHIKYATNGGILRYEIYSIIYDSSI